MTDLSVFGPLVTATQVEDAVTTTLQTWLPTYIWRTTRLVGQTPGWLPIAGSYVSANDPGHWPEEQLPAVMVVIPGTMGKPEQNGSRDYRAMWELHVVVFVQASDRQSTERLAKYYGAAVRGALIGKQSLGNFAAGVQWLGEEYDVRVSDKDQRTMGSCQVRFAVDVRDVVRGPGGPVVPEPDPGTIPSWPIATTVTFKVTHKP